MKTRSVCAEERNEKEQWVCKTERCAGVRAKFAVMDEECAGRDARLRLEPLHDENHNGRCPMLFMVVERFERNDMLPVYTRVRDAGRGLPEGLKYIDSWIEPNFGRCFQLMECDDLRRLQEWVLHWRGTGVTFEIVPVVESSRTREVVAPYLDAQ